MDAASVVSEVGLAGAVDLAVSAAVAVGVVELGGVFRLKDL